MNVYFKRNGPMNQVKTKVEKIRAPQVTVTILDATVYPPRVRVDWYRMNGWEGCALTLASAQAVAATELLKAKAEKDNRIIVPDMKLVQKPN